MRRTRLRGAAWLAALTIIGVACSGAPQDASEGGQVSIDNDPDRDGEVDDAEDPSPDGTAPEGEVGQDGEPGEPGEPVAPGETGTDGGTTDGGATSGTGDGGTSGGDTTGGTATTGDPGTTGGATGGSTGASAPSGPFTAEEATVGITDDEIYFCGHAALIFADAFDVRPEDLNVYFEKVNQEQGGVYGRKVRIDWEDDAYNPNNAITAAQTCNARNPFVLLGGIGFDQIPGVRNWAESNRVPYIHHIAVEPTKNPTFSFSFLPSVEKMGVAFGQYIAARHPGKKVGIISRESENWGPGHDAAVAELQRRGVEIVGDHETRKDQHTYQQELFQLQQAGAEVVWVWESALAAAEVLAQAKQQQFRPTWVVFPFQLTLDVAEPVSPVEGVAAWPSYAPGGYGTKDPVGHEADIDAFDAAYAKYRPSTTPNDLLYITWAGHKALHQVLLDCGPECDRNRLHHLLASGYKASPAKTVWQPNCAVDFGRGGSFGGHYGGFSFYAQQVYDHPGFGPAFRTTDYCWERYG